MRFNWYNYLHLADYLFEMIQSSSAEALSNMPDSEAFYRTVISRAYYSIYCSARNFAFLYDGFNPGKKDSHKALQDHFLLDRNHRLRSGIGRTLRNMRQSRNKADYDDEIKGDVYKNAKAMLLQAKKVFKDLESLP